MGILQFSHFWINSYLDCFQVFKDTDYAAVTILEQVCVGTRVECSSEVHTM